MIDHAYGWTSSNGSKLGLLVCRAWSRVDKRVLTDFGSTGVILLAFFYIVSKHSDQNSSCNK